MGKNLRKLFYLVNLIFTLLCLLHVTSTLYFSINPTHPETEVYDRDVHFPILLKICGREVRDSSRRFITLGYANDVEFYGGISKFSKNQTIVGWNGHTENGTTIGPLAGEKLLVYADSCTFHIS